jgi:hypothetical protein
MKKTFTLTAVIILTGLALNYSKALSQDVRKEPVIIKEPVITPSTGERGDRREREFYIQQEVKSTRLNLSKHFEGESLSKTGTFMVEEGIRILDISIKGSVQEGSITLSISKPGKNLFKELVIDSSADVEWNQLFTIREDNKENNGDWTYKIEAAKAKGFYSLSITAH